MCVVTTEPNLKKKFTEGNARKLTVSFAFVLMLTSQKSTNTDVFLWARVDYFSFRPMPSYNRKTIGSHLKVIPQNCIAHLYCARFSRHKRALTSACTYTAYTKWWLFLNCLACEKQIINFSSETSTGT